MHRRRAADPWRDTWTIRTRGYAPRHAQATTLLRSILGGGR
jgi:hypothetical protein